MVNQLLFGIIGFLMLAIAGVGAIEVEHRIAAAQMPPVEDTPPAAEVTLETSPTSAPVSATVASQASAPQTITECVTQNNNNEEDEDEDEDEDDEWDDEEDESDEEEDEDGDGEVVCTTRIVGNSIASAAPTQTNAPVSTPKPAPAPAPSGTTFTMAQVATHNSAASCYSVVNGSVYDLTAFVSRHPGGQTAIKSMCGVDGTAAFSSQHGGSGKPASTLAQYKIGALIN